MMRREVNILVDGQYYGLLIESAGLYGERVKLAKTMFLDKGIDCNLQEAFDQSPELLRRLFDGEIVRM